MDCFNRAALAIYLPRGGIVFRGVSVIPDVVSQQQKHGNCLEFKHVTVGMDTADDGWIPRIYPGLITSDMNIFQNHLP